MEEVERRLDEAKQTLEAAHAEAAQTQQVARSEAQDLVQAAEQQAASIVEDARTRALRVRTESERELAAATQRRDAINAQLGNVRQMLATLTGSVTAPDPFAADEPAHDEPESVPQAEDSSTVDAH